VDQDKEVKEEEEEVKGDVEKKMILFIKASLHESSLLPFGSSLKGIR
jgi:hypothetical protein